MIAEIWIKEFIDSTVLTPISFNPISGSGWYGTMKVRTIAPKRSKIPKIFHANKMPHKIDVGFLYA